MLHGAKNNFVKNQFSLRNGRMQRTTFIEARWDIQYTLKIKNSSIEIHIQTTYIFHTDYKPNFYGIKKDQVWSNRHDLIYSNCFSFIRRTIYCLKRGIMRPEFFFFAPNQRAMLRSKCNFFFFK